MTRAFPGDIDLYTVLGQNKCVLHILLSIDPTETGRLRLLGLHGLFSDAYNTKYHEIDIQSVSVSNRYSVINSYASGYRKLVQ